MSAARQPPEIGEETTRPPFHRRVRLTAAGLSYQREDRRVPFLAPAVIERRQRDRIGAIVAHAYAHVPFYRETMRALGLVPGDIAGPRDLAKLPLIEREQLQRDPEFFAAEGRSAGCVATRSGGTTSEPVTVYDDSWGLLERYSAMARVRPVVSELAGNRRRLRIARLQLPMSSGGILGRAYDRNLIRLPNPRAVELHLSTRTPVSENLAALEEFRPDVVAASGSYVEELFAHASADGRRFHRPKVVAYGAEALSTSARKMLSEQLGIAVLSIYQAIESPLIGFECERHRGHHLNVDLCPIRIVNRAGREQPPGMTGEVVISNLVNRTTVLLNYRLGDLAAMIPGECGCGRNLPMLSLVEGRTADWLVGADGRRLQEQILIRPFSLDREIWGYRVMQREPGKFDAEVILAAGSDPAAVTTRVRERFASIVGPSEKIEIAYVDSLPRTDQGKLRRVTEVNGPGETAVPGRDGPRGSS